MADAPNDKVPRKLIRRVFILLRPVVAINAEKFNRHVAILMSVDQLPTILL